MLFTHVHLKHRVLTLSVVQNIMLESRKYVRYTPALCVAVTHLQGLLYTGRVRDECKTPPSPLALQQIACCDLSSQE